MKDVSLSKISPEEVKHLVFNGGGVKGIAHVTAYAAMLACGVDASQIRGCNGTSAGSIISTLIAFRHTVDEMFKVMSNLDFINFLNEDGKTTAPAFVRAVEKNSVAPVFFKLPTIEKRIGKTGGIYNTNKLKKFINDMIFKKTGIKNCTFAEAEKWCTQNGLAFIDLQLVAYNENTQTSRTFSLRNSPNVVIADAVASSCAFKGVFETQFIRVKAAAGLVRETEDKYSDGGIVNNYDVSAWDLKSNGDEGFNRGVLGFKLTTAEEAAYIQGVRGIPNHPVQPGVSNFVKSTAAQVISAQDSAFLNTPKDVIRTIAIDNKDVKTFDMNLIHNKPLLEKLLKSGWDSSCGYFDQTHAFPDKFKVDHPVAEVVSVVSGPRGK